MFENLGTDGYETKKNFYFGALVPGHHRAFQYEGSLTTGLKEIEDPKTKEKKKVSDVDVKWFMLTDPLELSKDQLKLFRKTFPDGNIRNIEPTENGHMLKTNIPEPSTLWLFAIATLVAAWCTPRRERI
jgi:carbonic anhydrase